MVAGTRAHRRTLAMMLAFAAAVGLVFVAHARSADGAENRTDQTAVVRVYYESIRDLEQLASYDVWEVNNLDEQYVLAAVDQAALADLHAAGWPTAVDADATGAARTALKGNMFGDGYRTVDELYQELDDLASTYPTLVEVVTYGRSECLAAGGCTTPAGDELAGHDLRALRITNETKAGASIISDTTIIPGEKPVFFLMANIHAREITTPELAMRLAAWLLENYGVDADATWLVDSHEVWIVPTANPDGHWLVELGGTPEYGNSPLFHRKNFNQDANEDGLPDCTTWPSTGSAQFGVDLNRNHTVGWGYSGSSGIPCDLTYRGPAPHSELEVSSLQDLVTALIPDQRGTAMDDAAPADTTGIFITVHSYSELVLWPWGYLYEPAPNRDGLKAIGDKLASFNGYLSCQPTACLYAASGASDDWAYGELGIPAFTFEVGRQFMPPYSEIDAVQWPDNKPAFIYAARIARTPYLTALGPDSRAAEATAGIGVVDLQVVLDDTDTGNATIVTGEYSIDLPFWDDAHSSQTAYTGRRCLRFLRRTGDGHLRHHRTERRPPHRVLPRARQ